MSPRAYGRFTCPWCGADHDAATPRDAAAMIDDGAFLVCATCSMVGVVWLGMVRRPTPAEQAAIDVNPDVATARALVFTEHSVDPVAVQRLIDQWRRDQ